MRQAKRSERTSKRIECYFCACLLRLIFVSVELRRACARALAFCFRRMAKKQQNNKYILMCLNSLFYSSITFKPFSSNKYNMQWVVIRPAFIVLFQFPCMFFRLVLFFFQSVLYVFVFRFDVFFPSF